MDKKVTGLGGIFFKVSNPERTRDWYKTHLGIESETWGAQFPWRSFDNPEEVGYSAWSPFKSESTYFEPSDKSFMINYRVENLYSLIDELKLQGIEILGKIHEDEFGKFAWIMDPDGHKLELWEPPKD
jgi:catechol 2,3-dioxygenase-like lactoylglutathione lyase family enzyme